MLKTVLLICLDLQTTVSFLQKKILPAKLMSTVRPCKLLRQLKPFGFHEYFASFWTYENPKIAQSSREIGFVAYPKPYFLAFTSISEVFGPFASFQTSKLPNHFCFGFHRLPKTGQFCIIQVTRKISCSLQDWSNDSSEILQFEISTFN